tara:strand:- start:1187 stop:1498 length:312 start_codon:yes stop_codon:yes gene_type:complete
MRQRIDQLRRFEIQKWLEEVTTMTDEGVVYASGWNDAVVAERFGVSNKTICNTRGRTFGKLAKQPRNADLAAIEQRLQRLERIIGDRDACENENSLMGENHAS